MARLFDPDRPRPSWAAGPIPCEDCGCLLDPGDGWGPPPARVCRSCQNKRYEASIRDTAGGAERRRRKALTAKRRRLEARIQRDTAELAKVRRALGEETPSPAATGAQAWPPHDHLASEVAKRGAPPLT